MDYFQESSDFGNLLPTYRDVMKFFNFQRNKIFKDTKNKKEPGFQRIAIATANALINLYEELSIPTMEHRNVIRKLTLYHEKIVTMKSIIKRINSSCEV